MQSRRMQHKVAGRCPIDADGDQYLATKLVRFVCLTLANAFHFRRMPAIQHHRAMPFLPIRNIRFAQRVCSGEYL